MNLRAGVLVSILVACNALVFPARANVQTFGILGDAGKRNPAITAARETLRQGKISRLILPGDNIYDIFRESYASLWDIWKQEGFSFDVVAIGNHTLGYSAEMKYFGMPAENFNVVFPGIRFIVLNSDSRTDGAKNVAWAEEELKAAQEKFIFLVYHHPTYTVSPKHNWQERKEFQIEMRSLLERHRSKITAVLLGHDHISSIIDFGGIPAVVSGAAGEQREASALDYIAEDGRKIKTGWLYKKQASFARMDVNTAENTVWINFVESLSGAVICSSRIFPLPVTYQSNCAN